MLTIVSRHTLCGLVGSGLLCSSALAQETAAPATGKFEKLIVTRSPETRLDKADHDRLAVRRLDILDDKGVIRMTLAAPTPPPIVDGIQYKRAFPASGLVVYDKDGNERGGYVVADIEGSAAAATGDHTNGDAVGWKVMPDGSVTFQINERGPIRHEAALGGKMAIAYGPTRFKVTVAANGTPSIDLSDKQDRPRLRLTVTEQGFGSIEFLDADGKVVSNITPELLAADKSK